MSDKMFDPEPTFTNDKGETLPLSKIMNRDIKSTTISYLSKEKKVRADGFKGLLGFKKTIQDELEVVIEGIIQLQFVKGIESTTIRFDSKETFEKVGDDYSEDTLFKRYIMTIVPCKYQFNFHIGNLKKINWA